MCGHSVKVPRNLREYRANIELGLMYAAQGRAPDLQGAFDEVVSTRFDLSSTAEKYLEELLTAGHSKREAFTKALLWASQRPHLKQHQTTL